MSTVPATKDGISQFIIDRTKRVWAETSTPYMLAKISPDLQACGVEYKEILGSQSLKEFSRTLNDVHLVIHPSHKAKIGLIPKDATFEFQDEPSISNTSADISRPKKMRQPNQRYIVTQFLIALSRLDENELSEVSIPVSVLAKLLEEKE